MTDNQCKCPACQSLNNGINQSPADKSFNTGRIFGLREAYDVLDELFLLVEPLKIKHRESRLLSGCHDCLNNAKNKILELINKETHE